MKYKLISLAMVLLVILTAFLVFSAKPSAVAMPEKTAQIAETPSYVELQQRMLGGDCSADRATGDLYVSPDFYCLNSYGAPPAVIAENLAPVKSRKSGQAPVQNPPADQPAEFTPAPPTEVPPPEVTETTDHKNCNKGDGNGSEGKDPGNNPDRGNDDEDSDHSGNSGHDQHGNHDNDRHGENGDRNHGDHHKNK